ncbi:hypothetical protein GOBAR_AA08192 [Gossypium barbadense]|uniref:Uncharacterized protein n=1 Tax=Gossypium barbadense TaxID=3634 RepID=A0A2P5YA54_GOSBA|nr:hypothetical protein GOBAR_AA08192 [Gossypium barbadense]
MKLDLDAKIAAYVDSFTATCIKFIHLPPPATHKDVAVADFITSLVQIHGPLVKKVAANIVQYSSSGIDSHRLTALQDKQNVNIVELKNSDTEFTIPSYLNLVSSKLFPTVMLKPESLPMMNTLVRGLRKAKVGPILDLDNESESGGSFNGDQVKEIVCALEQSGHWFLWSLCQSLDPSKSLMASPTDYDDSSEVFLEGFSNRTHDIGKIIGCTLQVVILGHSVIGGFISHCGWNSTLKSILFGVLMATWPLYAEQQLNVFELVRELGLAVEINIDSRRDVINRGELEIVRAETIKESGV